MPKTLKLQTSQEPLDITVYRKTKVISGFSQGLKLKRPRAPYCERPWCPGNRAYLVNKGYTVEPSLYKPVDGDKVLIEEYTLTSMLINWFHNLIPAGFYHRWYIRNFWSIARKLIPMLSGHPEYKAYKHKTKAHETRPLEHVDVDILVIGGGIAGLAAAMSAASVGAKVLLVDTFPRLGGFMAHYTGEVRVENARADEFVTNLVNEARKAGATLYTGSRYIGKYEEGFAVTTPNRLLIVKPKSVIFATGGVSPPPLFENNDLPGIVSLSYAFRLFNTYNAKARGITVVGNTCWAVRAAIHFQKTMGDTHLIYTTEPKTEVYKLLDEAAALGVKLYNTRIRKALGKEHVTGLQLEDGNRINTKIIVSALTPNPDLNPPLQAGLELDYNSQLTRFMIRNHYTEGKPGFYVAGTVAGVLWEDQALYQGILAGYKAAANAGFAVGEETLKMAMDDFERTLTPEMSESIHKYELSSIVDIVDFWLSGRINGLQFVDAEMDVTLEDVVKTYESGYASMEKLKRYTALGTGAEQGRFSAQISSIMLSHLKKIPLNRLGLFRSRPPHEMPTFGELAAVEVD